MTKEHNPKPTARSKLSAITRLRAHLRRTSKTFRDLAMAMDYSDSDYMLDRIMALEKRVTELEEQVSLNSQNEMSREDEN